MGRSAQRVTPRRMDALPASKTVPSSTIGTNQLSLMGRGSVGRVRGLLTREMERTSSPAISRCFDDNTFKGVCAHGQRLNRAGAPVQQVSANTAKPGSLIDLARQLSGARGRTRVALALKATQPERPLETPKRVLSPTPVRRRTHRNEDRRAGRAPSAMCARVLGQNVRWQCGSRGF